MLNESTSSLRSSVIKAGEFLYTVQSSATQILFP
jgi:hypothetical protein